jgi:hypothetical protein
MKKLFFLIGFVLAGQCVMAQQKPTELDKSPMDITYFPANYPITKMRGQSNVDPLARIIYSRPQKKGREIFGGEVKYNEVWRLGANEATELELFKNATVGGKKIAKGRYTLYCIPSEAKWTIVVNKDNYSWGSFSYKADKDVARVDVPIQKVNDSAEALTMYFDATSLIIQWENLKVAVPVAF